jgi:HPr kinase/phosphorylase
MANDPEPPGNRLSIRELLESAPPQLQLSLSAGAAGLDCRYISSERIQKLGLALSGFTNYLHEGRIQMIGMSEVSFLETMSPPDRAKALANLDTKTLSCILVTKGLEPPEGVEEMCKTAGIPLFRTPVVSSKAISLITDFLQQRLALRVIQHGVLLEMFGIGVLIIGESGIGKSESALDLLSRQHRLVSDDVVRIVKISNRLYGDSPELTYEHLEIRGLGIINVRELFGISSICDKIQIDVCIDLRRWNDVENIERIGLEPQQSVIFGIPLPKFTLPVSPGRNLATLIETAVKVFLLRASGYDAARDLIAKHDRLLRSQKPS